MFEQPADFSFEFFSSSELINILHGFSHISGTTLSVISFTGNSVEALIIQNMYIIRGHVPYFYKQSTLVPCTFHIFACQ